MFKKHLVGNTYFEHSNILISPFEQWYPINCSFFCLH